MMTRRKKRQVGDSGSGLLQQGSEPALQRSTGTQLCLAPGPRGWQDTARKAAWGGGIPSCEGARAEMPPATPLRPLQQFLLAASGNKASPGPRMSQSQPFQGRQRSCQHCASPRLGQNPHCLHHDTRKSFMTPAVLWLWGGMPPQFPPSAD